MIAMCKAEQTDHTKPRSRSGGGCARECYDDQDWNDLGGDIHLFLNNRWGHLELELPSFFVILLFQPHSFMSLLRTQD